MASSSALVQAQVIDPSDKLLYPVATESIGRSLLIEEITTTWCPTCAEIDPYLKGVADSHGSRIAMVAYHPTDGEDAFQPPAAQHRIERLGILHGGAIPSPTFFVEGENPRSGTEAWSDVQRDILDLELTRQDTSTLQFEVVRNAEGITARVLSFEANNPELHESQLTFLVLEHQKTVPEGVVNPGEATRDRVLVATAECAFNTSTITIQLGLLNTDVNEGCNIDFEITFKDMKEFSILLIHENTEDAIANLNASLGTYGAVEFAYRSRLLPQSSWSLVSIALFIAAAAGLMAIVPRKN
jgi:thiol-disulfide isomerase/thioredoxin